MNLSYVLKHPTSRVVLRWIRRFGSYKQLVIVLMQRCPRKINIQTLWVARLQLARGCDVNAKDKNNWTPAHEASYRGCALVAGLLIRACADVEAKDIDNWTPLHWASYQDHASVVEMLIRAGADVNAKNKNNWTPLDIASSRGHISVIKLLRAAMN